MSSYQRLYVPEDLAADATITIAEGQAHYLRNVLRMQSGDNLLFFNGRDGEWRGTIEIIGKKKVQAVMIEQTRTQIPSSDIWLLIAPIKRARLDYLVQKATEMGAGRIILTLTDYTDKKPIKLDRLKANAIEAAEQCNILSVPEIMPPLALSAAIEMCENRSLIFCDETQSRAQKIMWQNIAPSCAVLIGPEGGFSDGERHMIYAQKDVHSLRLGQRILRSDTAVVAALALIQNYIGDWRE